MDDWDLVDIFTDLMPDNGSGSGGFWLIIFIVFLVGCFLYYLITHFNPATI